MRLVVEYSEGDGCTYSCTNTEPIEYESAEAFAVEFEQFCLDNKDHDPWCLKMFADKEWDVSVFFFKGKYYPPTIMTVDEWFNQ